MDVTQLFLTWVGCGNAEKLSLSWMQIILIATKVLDCKSTQVHARPGQMESQVYPSIYLKYTCDSVWQGFLAFNTLHSPVFVPIGLFRINWRYKKYIFKRAKINKKICNKKILQCIQDSRNMEIKYFSKLRLKSFSEGFNLSAECNEFQSLTVP